jgi:O-antigen ligase
MELFLVNLVALLRPLASLEFASVIFEIAGIVLFGLLVGAILANSAMRKALKISSVDAAISAFTLWCFAIYLIYFEVALIKEVGKLVVPLLSYIVTKNVVRDRSEYTALLRWALVGFSIPIVLSTVMIINGSGIDYVSYWTDLSRWRGAYEGSHSLGHSMTLFLMMLVLYTNIIKSAGAEGEKKRALFVNPVFGLLAMAALYCLYMSQVRTAVVGLILFSVIYLYFVNRKLLLIGGLGLGVLAILTVPFWLPALLPEFAMREKGIAVDTMELGSGRPTMWLNDLIVFANAPIDQQLAGIGIGNRGSRGGILVDADYVIYGHNDWLELLTQTGIVGVALFAWVQISIFRNILRMVGNQKYLYLAMFSAVNVMMVVSNSYAWRIQVSQLYYMALAYIEIQKPRIENSS